MSNPTENSTIARPRRARPVHDPARRTTPRPAQRRPHPAAPPPDLNDLTFWLTVLGEMLAWDGPAWDVPDVGTRQGEAQP